MKLSDNVIYELGIAKGAYEKNYGMQRVAERSDHEIYDRIAEAIKEKGGWSKMSAVAANREYGLSQTAMRTFAYHLQEHPNIIARTNPKYAGLARHERRTVPLEYSYVAEDEKKKLGFHAYGYKNVSDKYLERLKECFSDVPNVHINGLLSFVDCLFRRGADERWIRIEIMLTVRDAGISVEEAVEFIRHMSRKKLISIASVKEEGLAHEMRPACRFAVDEAAYEEYEKEIVNGDIEISEIDWKLKRLKKKPTNVSVQPFRFFIVHRDDKVPTEREVHEKIDELMKSYRSQAEKDLEKKYEQQIQEFQKIKSDYEKQGIRLTNLEHEYEKQSKELIDIGRKCEEQERQMSETNKKFLDAAADATNCRTRLAAAEAELRRAKHLNEKNIKFKEKLVDHLNEQLQILSSEMMGLSVKMTSAPHYQIRDRAFIASIRKESMEIVNNVSQEILNFKIEGVPNELVTSKEKKGLAHATS